MCVSEIQLPKLRPGNKQGKYKWTVCGIRGGSANILGDRRAAWAMRRKNSCLEMSLISCLEWHSKPKFDFVSMQS